METDMKKAFFKILAASLAALTLVSCNTTGDGSGVTTNNTVTTAPPSSANDPTDPGVDIMKFELSDYIKLGDYRALKIVKNVYCDDEQLAEALLLHAKEEDVFKKVTDRKTKEGDTINISYKGRIEDVYFEGGTAANATAVLTENSGYIDGFTDDLYDIMPGTTVTTNVTFPQNYGAAELAGMDAVFEITVNHICDYTLDDELVDKLTAGKYKTLEEFSKFYREYIIKTNLTNYENELFEQISKAVTDSCEIISYPQELVDYYYNDMISYYESLASSSGMDLDSWLAYYGVSKEGFLRDAKEYARADLALHAIFVAEGLTLSETDYRMKLNEMAKKYNYPSADTMEAKYGEYYMKNSIRKEMCIEHLKGILTIETDYDQYKHMLDDSAKTTEVAQ